MFWRMNASLKCIWAMTRNDIVLEVRALEVRYGIIPALRGVDIEVANGELVALVGPNGAGKTTLLRAISGLQLASAGAIRLDRTDITRLSPWEIATLGVAHVPQGRRVFPALSVEENLTVGGYRLPSREVRGRLETIYSTFPILVSKRRQMAAELSGGQQQMLVIGRALMLAPRLLLLDEPSLGLSPVIIQEMASTLRNLVTSFGTAILLAEQNTRLALKIAPRAYVIRAGKIVLEGESAVIAKDVQQAYLGTRRPADHSAGP